MQSDFIWSTNNFYLGVINFLLIFIKMKAIGVHTDAIVEDEAMIMF